MRISANQRQAWVDEARTQGSDNTLWRTATSYISNINIRYSRSQKFGNDFEIDFHDLWFLYYQASMNTSNESANQDRLVVQIIQTQQQGALKRRSGIDGNAAVVATTSDGLIWTDLPFFVSDMTRFWTNDWVAMSAANRINFASFVAKLASVGITEDKLCGIALSIFCDALETARPLGSFGEGSAEDPNRHAQDVTIADLLPVANVWLFHARLRLIQLSDALWNECTNSIGELFRADPLSSGISAGFSPQRWIFWLRRLEEVGQQATQAGDTNLAEYAFKVMDNMLLTLDEGDSTVQRMMESLPGVVKHQPMVQELGPM